MTAVGQWALENLVLFPNAHSDSTYCGWQCLIRHKSCFLIVLLSKQTIDKCLAGVAISSNSLIFYSISGQDVRKLMDKYDVNIMIPPLAQASNTVKISGIDRKVTDAIVGLEERIKELESDKADRVS